MLLTTLVINNISCYNVRMQNLEVLKNSFTAKVADFINVVAKKLPDDVLVRLKEMQSNETEQRALAVYDCIFKNLEKAISLDRPICQDTGVVQFFVKVGTNFPLINDLESCLRKAVEIATEKAPLRHNAVETFIEKNTGTNLGTGVPYIEYDLIPNSDKLELTVYLAGGGCSLPGRSTVLMPSEGYEGAFKFVADTLVTYGINACPPLVIGVGFGPCMATSAKLAKKASLRSIGSHNPNEKVAEMEVKLQSALNKIAIGPQGLGGTESVVAVNIENMARHPSSFGVAVAFGCWAHRRGVVEFNADLSSSVLSHEGVAL